MDACITNQISDVGNAQSLRRVRIHHQHIGHLRHAGDGREIAHRVVGQLAVQPGVDGVGGYGTHHQRVAVGCRFGHQVSTQIAAGTGLVVDDHGAQRVLHALGQRAGDDVQRATMSSGPPGG